MGPSIYRRFVAKSKPAPSKYRVDYVERAWEDPSGFAWRNEHRVVEVATGRVVLTFEETPDLWHAYDPGYEGVSSVTLDADGAHVLVRHHGDDELERVEIPESR